jgi:hypothetical protein
VGLERRPLSLVSTVGELLGRKRSCSGLENREYDRRDPLCSPLDTIYPQKLALTSSTSGGCSVGIVRSRSQATEFSLVFTEGAEKVEVVDIKIFGVAFHLVPMTTGICEWPLQWP